MNPLLKEVLECIFCYGSIMLLAYIAFWLVAIGGV